jgi:hypothetical protein
MEDEHGQWMTRHQAATDAEVMHRKALMEQERKHLLELQSIEQEISKQRIQALNVLETTAAEEMELMDKLSHDAQKLLADSESHLREKMELTLNIQKHRELAEVAESLTHEKLNKISMRRARDEVSKLTFCNLSSTRNLKSYDDFVTVGEEHGNHNARKGGRIRSPEYFSARDLAEAGRRIPPAASFAGRTSQTVRARRGIGPLARRNEHTNAAAAYGS